MLRSISSLVFTQTVTMFPPQYFVILSRLGRLRYTRTRTGPHAKFHTKTRKNRPVNTY